MTLPGCEVAGRFDLPPPAEWRLPGLEDQGSLACPLRERPKGSICSCVASACRRTTSSARRRKPFGWSRTSAADTTWDAQERCFRMHWKVAHANACYAIGMLCRCARGPGVADAECARRCPRTDARGILAQCPRGCLSALEVNSAIEHGIAVKEREPATQRCSYRTFGG